MSGNQLGFLLVSVLGIGFGIFLWINAEAIAAVFRSVRPSLSNARSGSMRFVSIVAVLIGIGALIIFIVSETR